MRVVVAIGVALAVAGGASGSRGTTALRIAYRADPAAHARVLTLRCGPPRGTVVDPVRACRQLARLGRAAFVPTPPGTACTQIYGGPEVARVTGILSGRAVWATFRRRDGCEIARWNRVRFLLPRA